MVMFETPGLVGRLYPLGALRALAVNSPQRCAALPDVPTMAEAGVPDYLPTPGTFLRAGPHTEADHRPVERRRQPGDRRSGGAREADRARHRPGGLEPRRRSARCAVRAREMGTDRKASGAKVE